MKKVLFLLCLITTIFCSCDKDKENEINEKSKTQKMVGEWKATKIDATFNDGTKLTITDPEGLEEQLDGLEWISVTENHFQIMSDRINNGHQVLLPYDISDNYIVFTGAESTATYYLQSVTDKEMIIKYIDKWTSLIYYTKVK